MLWWFSLAQLGFAALIAALVIERLRTLCWREAVDDVTFRRLLRAGEGQPALLARFVASRPGWALGPAFLEGPAEAREAIADLRELATSRLRLLRVAATLASTLGLLGGISMLAGAELPGQGLLALSAGAVERARMDAAITTMAIGVGSSAFCFQALSLLRGAAQRLLQQADQIARARGLL